MREANYSLKKYKKKNSTFDIINYTFLTLFGLICFYPLWYILVISFSTFKGYYSDVYHLIPNSFTLDNYINVFKGGAVIKSFGVSAVVTLIGTTFSMLLTVLGGYVFTKTKLPGMKTMFKIAVFTMYFSGGLVPIYLLVSGLGLKDTIWAMILPTLINTYNLIIAKSFFMTLPASLEESAKMDGANELIILFKIILPISKPMIAALTLFYAVGYWNNWYHALLFINKMDLMPVQLVIRNLLNGFRYAALGGNSMNAGPLHEKGLHMASVLIAILPIIAFYPLLQKHFAKGVMIGAVKE